MRTITIATVLLFTVSTQANMQITEYMYSGALVGGVDGEFIEFTNMSASPVNMGAGTGYSFDDSSETPGSFSLSSFGTAAPGESVILCQATAAAFRTAWGLAASVKVIGANDQNLGRDDEINIYDNTGALVDRLLYGDDINVPGTIRTQNSSGWAPSDKLGPFTINADWRLSTVADAQSSHAATTGNIGNPGTYVQVPEPATLALLVLGSAFLGRRYRRGTVR